MPRVIWDMDPVFVTVFDHPIRYYTLCFALTLVFGYVLFARQLERGGGDREDAGDFFTYGFFGLLVGARVGQALFYDFGTFLSEPSWILRLWTGGMASHGALVGLCLAMYWFTKRRGVPFLEGTDRLALAVPVGAFFFRLGNLFNSEIVGAPTAGGWGMGFPRYDPFDGAVDGPYRHPTQLYEMALALAVFALLVAVDRRCGRESRPRGLLTGVVLSVLFSGRILIEFFKERQPGEEITGLLNRGQVLSIPVVIAGLAILFASLRTRAPAGWVVGTGSSKRRKRDDDEDDDFDDEDGGSDPHEPRAALSRA